MFCFVYGWCPCMAINVVSVHVACPTPHDERSPYPAPVLSTSSAELVSRDQILRRQRGQGNVNFPCSADHEQDWHPYPVDPCACVCVCVFFPFILDITFVGRTSRGHTGFFIHLLSAVRALIFLARRIQPFLSLVDREVEFCVLTI